MYKLYKLCIYVLIFKTSKACKLMKLTQIYNAKNVFFFFYSLFCLKIAGNGFRQFLAPPNFGLEEPYFLANIVTYQ